MANRDKKIFKIISMAIDLHLPEDSKGYGSVCSEWVVRHLNQAGYEIIEDDYISVKIHAEIKRRIQEKYNLAEDDIMGFIVEELDKFEKQNTPQ